MGAITDAIVRMFAKVHPPDQPTSKDERNEERKASDQSPLATMGGSTWDVYNDRSKIERTRMARYKDYDQFDEEDSLAAGVLDVYTDHALHSQESDETLVEIETESEKLKAEIEAIFDQVTLQDFLWPLTRDMVKFGDAFEEHVFTKDRELVGVEPLNRTMIYRSQKKDEPLEERGPTGKVVVTFNDVEATHFRLRRSRGQEYGTSVLAPVRKVYKQLSMMEEGIVVRRLTRATQRYGFVVPTGKLVGDDARKYIQNVRNDLKKRRLVTADGKVSVREAPIFQDEDFFIAQPDGGKADIKVLQADGGLGDIGDIQHFLNKFFSGAKVPKAWLGFEADVNAKATLTEEAIAFARAARRVQTAVQVGLHHIVDSAFIARGVDPTQLPYRILLPAMSTVDEMRDLEVQKLKADIAKIYAADIKAITNHIVLTQFMGLSEEEAYEIEQDIADQAQLEAEAQSAGQQQAIAAQSQQLQAANEEKVWLNWRVRQLSESARSLALWSLEQKAWERAADPAHGTVVYLGE